MKRENKQVKMTKSEMDLASFLLEKTGALSKDCYELPDRIIFLVTKGDIGKVIGESGIIIKTLRRDLKKEIDVFTYSSDFEFFIANIFHPAIIHKMIIKNNKLELQVEKKDIGRVIGKGGAVLAKAKLIINRHFENIEGIRVIEFKQKETKAEYEKEQKEIKDIKKKDLEDK
ncbi:MAG: NusA-like transcription termination signal-binding factor [Candidatus Thorarchaeota archaeon]